MKIVFLVQSMGYSNNLLYWEAILQELYNYNKEIVIFTRDTVALVRGTKITVEKFFPRGKFSAILKIPNLFLLSRHEKECIFIVSEFNAITLSAVFVRLLTSEFKLVLLIENHPKYLLNYRKQPRKLISYLNLLYRRFISLNVDTVVANTIYSEEYALNELRVPNDKVIRKMYLTSSFSNINERAYCINKKKVTFLSVGSIDFRKGFDLLLCAISQLEGSVRERCKFVIVGDGMGRREIEMMIEKNSLKDSVQLTGNQSYDQMKNWFLSADVAVITTRGDYRSLVGFEALSCGLPIIASVHDGASDEVVVEGCNGFIIDPNDIRILGKKIAWFVNNRAQLEQFGRFSLQRAKLFTPKIAGRNLYEAAIYTSGKL